MNMPVNITTDVVLEGAIHPAPLPPLPNASVAGTVQGHLPGVWTHSAKLTRSVTHNGQPIVQHRHDCGPMIPHLTLPVYANPWYAVIMPGSSCKVPFGASTVKINGRSTGMAGIGSSGALPMMTCAFPVSLPTALPVSTFNNTVSAGMLGKDLLAGCVAVALKMISDGILHWCFIKPPTKVGPGAGGFLKRLVRELFPKRPGKKDLAKTVLATASRFAVSTLEDNPTFQVSIGKPLLRGKVKLQRKDGKWKPGVEARVMGARVKDGRFSILGEELR